jgi:hypothetical protein
VVEAGAAVGGEQEGGQVEGEQAQHEPDQFHDRSRVLALVPPAAYQYSERSVQSIVLHYTERVD